MKRVADSTIKGFIYQFNVTLEQILESTHEKIQIEGIIEDIDIVQDKDITAIQCKYHESAENFNLSAIRKPILQMLKTECESHRSLQLSYVLYAYFPNLPFGVQHFGKEELNKMLRTTDEKMLLSYIAHIIDIEDDTVRALISKSKKTPKDKATIKKYILDKDFKYKIKVNLDSFLERFSFKIGKNLEDIQTHLCDLLIKSTTSFSKKDVVDIVYPNAIQTIADLSTKDDNSRVVTRNQFLKELERIKSTAITRWTRELLSYRQLLNVMKKQLHYGLNKNYQDRLFLLSASNFDDFDEKIVTFLKDFCDIYTFKPQLHLPATFCILDYDKHDIDMLVTRLFKVNIQVEDGFKGSEFFPEYFFRTPLFNHKEGKMEFKLRLCNNNEAFRDALKRNKPEVIYSVVDQFPSEIEKQDIRVELIDTKTIQDLEYVLGMRKEP